LFFNLGVFMRALIPALSAVLLIGGLALAQGDLKTERVITVAGTATVYAKPDVARVYYGIKASEPSADAVKDVLTKNTKAIDDAVAKLKLTNLTVTSAPIGIKHSSGNVNANLGGVPVAPGGAPAAGGGLGPMLGYTSQTATITNSDPDKLRAEVDAFVKTIAEAGANTSGGEARDQNVNIFPGQEMSDGPKVVLGRADDTAARDEALQKAVEKAVRNAKAIAKGLGAGEVKVLSVADSTEAEKPAADTPNIYGIEFGSPTAPRSPAGLVEVKVKVIVKCSY
jgi:uncharacterized protein YggE